MTIAVVIPCYRVGETILKVLSQIGPEVNYIVVVDDACPMKTGKIAQENCHDPRMTIVYHERNQGVGGAVVSGYHEVFRLGADIAIKLDGDGQMDPRYIKSLAHPIELGNADYTKGNRFYSLDGLKSMPTLRLLGNSGLSLISKLSTGYWSVMDPTNGFTAVHTKVLKQLPIHKIEKRFFFETDMLFRLCNQRAVVQDIPMFARYGEEVSNLRISNALLDFSYKNLVRFMKRMLYQYFLHDFNIGTVSIFLGFPLFLFGLIFGGYEWYYNATHGGYASSGTVMLAAIPFVLGTQFLMNALLFDIQNQPKQVVHVSLPD